MQPAGTHDAEAVKYSEDTDVSGKSRVDTRSEVVGRSGDRPPDAQGAEMAGPMGPGGEAG